MSEIRHLNCPQCGMFSDEAVGKRLRRVCNLLGLENAIPENDVELSKVAFSVLGMIARKIEILNQKIVKVTEREDSLRDTLSTVHADDAILFMKNEDLKAQVTRLTADIEALKIQLQSEKEAATSLANAVVSLTSEKIRLTAQNAIAMEALEKIENNGCDCDSWESCRNNHVSTSQDALSRIRELEAAK